METGTTKMRICVFAGSALDSKTEYNQASESLGKAIVSYKANLVYGGGSVGLLGIVAKTVKESLGEEAIYGIITEEFVEVAGELIGITDVVKSYAERKDLMFDHSDMFITLPGGFGTLDEIATFWIRCAYENKPIGILNVNNFYDKFIEYANHMVQEGFLSEENRAALIVSEDPIDLIKRLEVRIP